VNVLLDLGAFVVAMLLPAIIYPSFIRWLGEIRSRQVIQEELPESHQRKAGTPTGGGALFVGLAVVAGFAAMAAGHPGALPAIVALLAGGVIGLVDDVSKLRRGSIGIPARLKFPIQIVLAIPVAWIALDGHQLWLLPVAVVAVVGTANAVNITDGMDGLAAGLSIIAIGATVLFLPNAASGEKAVALTLCGGLGAFLIFNRYPARVFMGDTGALAIGFALAAMAIQQGLLWLLPIVALVFVLETLSVIIQVAYFKATGGRRVFPMTPIHYTFHHEGWSENRIALTFWGAGLISAIVAVALVHLRF
jgi:phospho-N-acetylmuramoyl-pentapeptide-transferase